MEQRTVYETLRQEILEAYGRQVSLVTFGFTVTIAVFGWAFTAQQFNSLVFLMPLLILGFVLVQLNAALYTILTISVYIRLHIESKAPGDFPKWENQIGSLRKRFRKDKPIPELAIYNPLIFFDAFVYACASGIMGFVCVALAYAYAQLTSQRVAAVGAALVWGVICWLIFGPMNYARRGQYEEKLQDEWKAVTQLEQAGITAGDDNKAGQTKVAETTSRP